ncbi:MAG: RsmF rRNA methyltransferase first C-terminal domain-containing protein [Eubacteriales bacterium]|nr:RsmF rRNA methyltransferase first C-terminal domain-containing protein [Eubacteriales bacterium]
MLPQEFLERMQGMLQSEYPLFLQSLEQKKYQSLRINPQKGSREDFLKKSPFALSEVEWEKNGFYYEETDRPGRHPYHEAGVYYIQEASAMAPAVYLDAQPGEQVLDLCAAPGGKSTQIAAAMEGRGILLCNEIHPARAKILSENVERMGIINALVTNETPDRLAEHFPEYFDRILVDAPCSGEGMFRKNEAACDEWSPDNVQMCAGRQDEILDRAAQMLRAGGRMVYSTCTFAPAEDEGSIMRFLRRHPDFTIENAEKTGGMDGGHPEWVPEEETDGNCGIPKSAALTRTIRLWPHKVKGEGHYLAVLRKEGDVPAGYRGRCRFGTEAGIAKKDCEGYLQFQAENLKTAFDGVFLKFGDQLYLAPENTPSLRGLKALRPGLHLGTMKKNRFEPSHALAMALKPQEAARSLALAADSAECRAWLNGMTLSAQGEKGWYLVTADGYSIGWGKLAGTVLKNHYPKGLRKNF